MKSPERPATACPKCGSIEIDVLHQGLWHGRARAGKLNGGSFEYGVCRRCGTHCARWTDAPAYVPPDDEWDRVMAPLRKLDTAKARWPFIADYGEKKT